MILNKLPVFAHDTCIVLCAYERRGYIVYVYPTNGYIVLICRQSSTISYKWCVYSFIHLYTHMKAGYMKYMLPHPFCGLYQVMRKQYISLKYVILRDNDSLRDKGLQTHPHPSRCLHPFDFEGEFPCCYYLKTKLLVYSFDT